MDEVDRRVRLQQVAPCPFPSMGFARDQQHPQTVANAVHVKGRAVVAERQFPRRRFQRELDNVRPAMGDLGGQFHLLPRTGEGEPCNFAVDGNLDPGGIVRCHA